MSSLPTGDQAQTVAIQDQLLLQQPDEQQQQQQQQLYTVPDSFAVSGVLDSVAAPTFDEQQFQPQFHADAQPQAPQVQVLEFHQQPQTQIQQPQQQVLVTTTTGGPAIGQLQQVYFQPQQQIVQQQAQPQAVVLSQRDPVEVQNMQHSQQQQQQQQPQQIVLQQQTVPDAIVTAPVSLAVTTVTEPPMITGKAETAVKSPAVAKPKRATRKKKDPNAPASVSSAYAFFFKDTQASVKSQNPNAKFGEVSKIVAQMWEAMGDEDKSIYKKRNEQDKVRYEREMTEYKERQESQADVPAAKSTAATASQVATAVKSRPVRAAAAAAAAAAAKSAEATKSDEEDAKPTPAPAPITTAPAPELEPSGNVCIRQGCAAKAVKSPEWEDEYCSNKCVVAHCRDVFAEWVLAQKAAAL